MQVLIPGPLKMALTLKTTAHFSRQLLSFLSHILTDQFPPEWLCDTLLFSSRLQRWHTGSLSIIIASISATTLLLLCSNAHKTVYMQHMSTCVKVTSLAMVTDTTHGDFTTHSTKGQILDHTVLRHWERKINAITARGMTCVTGVSPAQCRLLIALTEHWHICYHNVSKQLEARGRVWMDCSHSPRTVSLL